jgi:hypothetical protein
MDTKGNPIGTYPAGDTQFSSAMAGPDGALYLGGWNPQADLVRVTMQGQVTHLGNDGWGDTMSSIITGLDGNLWMSGGFGNGNKLLSFDVQTQTWVARIKAPGFGQIITGPDGHLWLAPYNVGGLIATYAP